MEEQKASAEGMAGEHTLAMTRCSELSLTGVREVRSFDENEVKMDTSCGILLIRGEGLHVKFWSPSLLLISAASSRMFLGMLVPQVVSVILFMVFSFRYSYLMKSFP